MPKHERLDKSVQCLYYISDLKKEELREFESFLQSPFFNVNKKLSGFFHVLKKHLLSKEEAQWPSKRELFSLANPDQAFSQSFLNKKFFELKELLFDFWEIKEHQLQRTNSKILVFRALQKRNLCKHLSREVEKEIAHQESRYLGIQATEEIFQLEILKYQQDLQGSPRQSQGDFKSLFQIAEKSIFLRTLRMSLADLDRSRSLKIQIPALQITAIVASWRQVVDGESRLLAAYLKAYDFLTGIDDKTQLEKLLADLKDPTQKYENEAEQELLSLALNECIRRTNSGDIKYGLEAINVYQMLLKSDLPNLKRTISILHVKNIIQLYCKIGMYPQAEALLRSYQGHINQDAQEKVRDYGLGLIAFFAGRYLQAIDFLNKPDTKKADVFVKIDSKLIALKAMYECYSIDQEEIFKKKTTELGASLNRQRKLQPTRYKGHRKFLKCLRMIWKIRWGNPDCKDTDLEKLKQKVDNMRSIANTDWLDQKISELKK